MSKRIFNQEQIETLLQNSNVAGCSEKSISYHKDFKKSTQEKKWSDFQTTLLNKRKIFKAENEGEQNK